MGSEMSNKRIDAFRCPSCGSFIALFRLEAITRMSCGMRFLIMFFALSTLLLITVFAAALYPDALASVVEFIKGVLS